MPNQTVISAVDDNYVLPLLVMIHSAKKNSKSDFQFVLGYDPASLSTANLELIEECLTFLKVPFSKLNLNLENEFKHNGHITPTSYARLPMADALSGLVLWLDADLICRPGWDEIFEFFDANQGGKIVAAVRDSVATSGRIPVNTKNLAKVKMRGDYFNTGVLLVDCNSWRLSNASERWPVLVENSDELGFEFSDQCVLNFLMEDSYHLLPTEFNVLAFYSSRVARAQAKILHFAGIEKPWNYRRLSSKILFTNFSRRDIWEYIDLQNELLQIVRRASRGHWKLLDLIARRNKNEKWITSYKKNAFLRRHIPPLDN